ncbi:MAG: FixH family protein [Hyphomicrobiaceae bacterium]
MKWIGTVVCAGTLMLLPVAALAGQRPMVKVACKPTEKKLVYRCMFNVMGKKNHQPIEDAAFKVNADMPAMPMAHNVKRIEPKPVAGKPGLYEGDLHLEMMGEWVLKLTFDKPARDVVIKKLMFGDIAMGGEASNDGKDKMQHTGHGGEVDKTKSE